MTSNPNHQRPAHRSRAGPSNVTVKAIAEAAGLSQPAVSQVINGKGRISPATRDRVMAIVESMGYRANAAARAVVTKRTYQIGVLVLNDLTCPDSFPHTYSTILGMNMALEPAGFVLSLVRIGDVQNSFEGQSRAFREHVLDGIIITTQLSTRLADRVQELVPCCVWADTNVWKATHCVRRDEYAVGVLCAQAAADAGYRKVLYVNEKLGTIDGPDHYSHQDRYDGILEVCRLEKIDTDFIRYTWNWSEQFARDLLPRLSPDVAVITTDAYRARMVQQTAAMNDLRIGRDFGLVCCDLAGDVNITWPQLAGVMFDRLELGRRGAEMMLSTLADDTPPKSTSLSSAWHAGETLKRPPVTETPACSRP